MEYMKYIFAGSVSANVGVYVNWWLGASTLVFLYLICLEIDAIRRALK